tara:strand:- start:3861 stop:4247 length:387 start_codon:yes stop_codon:yes gene_type:complete
MNRGLEQSFREKLVETQYQVVETSYLGLRPGDLIQLTYTGQLRYGLVVSSKRTTDGMFLSSRNNTLVNVVLTDSLSDAMFSLMINNLYNNEIACNYNSPAIVGAFLGKQNFRTFNVAKMRDIFKVVIV